MNEQKTYHIYLRDECLFKDLSESEFEVIWGRIYQTYFMEELRLWLMLRKKRA